MRDNWWAEFLRWTITVLVFGIYTALTFFSFRGNWEFLTEFEYYSTVVTTTSLSIFLRGLWATKGLRIALDANTDIKEQEKGKGELIATINSNDWTDELKLDVDEVNYKEKKKEYANKIDRKIYFYRTARFIPRKFKRSRELFWVNEKERLISDEVNLDNIKVWYYELSYDDLLTSFYKEGKLKRKRRGTLSGKVLSSTRMNAITIISMAFIKGIEFAFSSFTWESVMITVGQFIVFAINIHNGLNMGKEFIDGDYSQDLTEDYIYLKGFIKKMKNKGGTNG